MDEKKKFDIYSEIRKEQVKFINAICRIADKCEVSRNFLMKVATGALVGFAELANLSELELESES